MVHVVDGQDLSMGIPGRSAGRDSNRELVVGQRTCRIGPTTSSKYKGLGGVVFLLSVALAWAVSSQATRMKVEGNQTSREPYQSIFRIEQVLRAMNQVTHELFRQNKIVLWQRIVNV